MLIFISAVPHPVLFKDPETTGKLFKIFINSVLSQKNRNFKLVIVCNNVSGLDYAQHPDIHYHFVDFPLPGTQSYQNVCGSGLWPFILDKATKLLSGLLYTVNKFNSNYIFPVDYDDWLHIDIVDYILSAKSYPISYVDRGYFVDFKNKTYKRRAGLVRYCGSTNIYETNFLLSEAKIRSNINENSDQYELIRAVPKYFLCRIIGDHKTYFYFKQNRITPRPIPFPAACWVIGSGQNLSATYGKGTGLPIDESFTHNFGLPQEVINPSRITFKGLIRERLGYLRSIYTWQKSKLMGRFIY